MRLFLVPTGLPVTRPRQSLYCTCAAPVVERIALFDTSQCATCWRPFAPGAPRLAPQSSGEARPSARYRASPGVHLPESLQVGMTLRPPRRRPSALVRVRHL